MINYYKSLCIKLNIDFKKDLIITSIISGACAIIGLIFMFVISFICGFLLLVAGGAYFLSHYYSFKGKYQRLVIEKEIAFNGFYRYLITLLKNGTVLYGALQESLEYVDEVLKKDVETLIGDIEQDTSLDPFIKFMNNFNDESIKQMVILLYKTQDSGIIDEVIESINECMVNLQDSSIESFIDSEQKSIEKYYMYPIILSAFVMIIVSFYVFSLISGGNYV